MTDINRRQLLKGAVLGSAGTLGAAAFVALAQQPAEAATVSVATGERDPNFAQGVIQSIEKDALMVVNEEYLIQRVQLTDSTRVWKGFDTTLESAQVGDFLYARGEPDKAGAFIAETIWVNIVNLHVEINNFVLGQRDLGQGEFERLELLDAHGPLVGHLSPNTAFVRSGAPATRDLSQLQFKQHVQVIGALRSGTTDEVDISTIFV